MVSASSGEAEADREVVISRTIEGPRPLVFEVYTSVAHLSAWWGPNGFSTTTQSFEFREGGVWVFVMHGPDGVDYPNYIEWLEIVPCERIVLLHGERAGDPQSFRSTITFVDRGGATEVTLRALFPSKQRRDFVVENYGAIEGGKQTLGRLAAYVAWRGAQ